MSIPLTELPEGRGDPDSDLRALTRLALSQALRELVDLSLSLVPTFGEEGLRPGSYAGVTRRIGVLYKRVRVLGVLNERIVLGAPWTVIDHYLGRPAGYCEEVFAEMEQRWRSGDPAPWAPVFDAVDLAMLPEVGIEAFPLRIGNLVEAARELDRFCLQHIPFDDHDRGHRRRELLRPVSSGLPQ